MAERGRQPGFVMSNEHRTKIQNSNILNALVEHALGQREMASTQVTAALGLLKKIMPDLESVDSTVHGDQTVRVVSAEPMTADEWERRYSDAASLGTATGTAKGAH